MSQLQVLGTGMLSDFHLGNVTALPPFISHYIEHLAVNNRANCPPKPLHNTL